MLDNRHFDAGDDPSRDSSRPATPTLATRARPDPRSLILDAMIEAVAVRGYDRTTVSRVLWGADLPEAVFSEHFHDKHDCFTQAVERLLGGAERTALRELHLAAPWPERVRSALGLMLAALADAPDAARVVLVEMLSAGPEACERHRAALALFASLMEEGLSCCESPENLPPQTSEAIVGGIASILQRRALEGDTASLPALHRDLTYFALLPYLDHDRAMEVAGL